MGNYNLDFDWHKIAYEGKWATGININGSRKWTEETTPTRSSNLKTHLPFTDWGNFTNIKKDHNATYDYARNQYWQYHSTAGVSDPYSPYVLANAKNTSVFLSYLPVDNRKAFGLSAGAPARKLNPSLGYLLDNFYRPTAKGSYTNGGLGPNYTLTFWLYWGATDNRSNDSEFSFFQCGDDQNMRNTSGRQNATYSGGALYDNYSHKFTVLLKAASQKLYFWFETKGGQTEFASFAQSYWGTSIPASTCPPRTWTKCSVMVSGNNVAGMSFATMPGNDNSKFPDLRNFKFYSGPWSLDTYQNEEFGGAKRLKNADASNRLQQEYATIAGPDIRVSQFRGYNQAWKPAGQSDIHSFQHRNQWGDLPSNWSYPAPPAEQFIQTPDEPNLIGESSTLDTEFINHLTNGLNRNLSGNDAKQWIEDFDATHGTKYSVSLLPATNMVDMEQEKINSVSSMDLRDFEKTKEVKNLL